MKIHLQKASVSPLYGTLKRRITGADSPQKLFGMQDATGAIVISYQTYLVENRAVPVVGIINVPRYGTPKNGKNHPTVTFILIHQEYIIETI